MRKILTILMVLITWFASAQQDIPANYIHYQYTYGTRIDRGWFDKAIHVPRDTVYTKSGLAIKGSNLYYGDSTRWYAVGTGGTGTVTNFTFTNANSIYGTVTNPTTTPSLSLAIKNSPLTLSYYRSPDSLLVPANDGTATLRYGGNAFYIDSGLALITTKRYESTAIPLSIRTGNENPYFYIRTPANPSSNDGQVILNNAPCGLCPEVGFRYTGDDLGFVRNVVQNAYTGSASGGSSGFLAQNTAWSTSGSQWYQGTPYNSFAPNGLLIYNWGKMIRYHVDSTGGYHSFSVGALGAPGANEKVKITTDSFYVNNLGINNDTSVRKVVTYNTSSKSFGYANWVGGAGGGTGITVNSTTITGGTDTRVPFNDAGVYNEDAGLSYAKTTDILTVVGSIVSPQHTGSISANGTLILTGNNAAAGNTATNVNQQFKVGNSSGTTAMSLYNSGVVHIGNPTYNASVGLNIQNIGNTVDDGTRVYANNLSAYQSFGYGGVKTAGQYRITGQGGILLQGLSDAIKMNMTSGGKFFFGGSSTPSETIETNGNIRLNAITNVTTNDSTLYIEDGIVKAGISAAEYNPTVANVNNTSGLSISSSFYSRRGAYITVNGYITGTITAASALTTVSVTLQTASNFAAAANCIGTGTALLGVNTTEAVRITADATNDVAVLDFYSPAGSAGTGFTLAFTFTYKII